jgi:ERCC4-related helicase
VIRNLRICRVEFRDEQDADVARYCHERTVDTLLVDPSGEVQQLRGLLQQLLLTKLQALQQAKVKTRDRHV